MIWRRISATESRVVDHRGAQVVRVWRTAVGWFGAAAGQQSGEYGDESAAREWAEHVMEQVAA